MSIRLLFKGCLSSSLLPSGRARAEESRVGILAVEICSTFLKVIEYDSIVEVKPSWLFRQNYSSYVVDKGTHSRLGEIHIYGSLALGGRGIIHILCPSCPFRMSTFLIGSVRNQKVQCSLQKGSGIVHQHMLEFGKL
jgi:hypothetical protein